MTTAVPATPATPRSDVVRKSADERRDEILDAAFLAFGRHGFDGTSTEDIAKAAGVSQPYLFRLFGTKKQLFLAAVVRLHELTGAALEAGIAEMDEDADCGPLEAIGHAYKAAMATPGLLRMQMQALAACADPDVRAVVREGYGRLVDRIQASTNASPEVLSGFVAKGMLLNVLAAMDVLYEDSGLPWAERLKEGCLQSPIR
ncbi:MAG: TetR/AcrR family transcriptional regulator [Candidatus Limnocylindrales bacterium]